MSARFVSVILIVVASLMFCGCKSLVRPSNAARDESYARYQKVFGDNKTNALLQTYFVMSGGSGLGTPVFRMDGTGGAKIDVSGTNAFWFNEGLAVSLTKDGYLLTAAHVLRSRTFVVGMYDGKVGLRAARVVFKSDAASPADVALIKVDAQLDHCATFGHELEAGERVFAVGCYRKQDQMGGAFGTVAGDILKVTRGPAGSPVDLVYTDIPLWEGDSGGPLLSSTGQLIGITTKYRFHWYGIYWKARRISFAPRISFFPEEHFIRHLIAEDRASHNLAETHDPSTPGLSSVRGSSASASHARPL